MSPTAGRTAARLARVVEKALDEVELSMPQYRVLSLLSESSAAAKVLASQLVVSKPSVTALVDGLVARGLVERRPDPEDRRRVVHELTDEGAKLVTRADEATAARLASLCRLLSRSKQDRAGNGLALWDEAIDRFREARVAAS